MKWNQLYSAIVHEWVHHKQYIRRPRRITPLEFNTTAEYFGNSDEQMAWGVEETEYLRKLLKTTSSKRILQLLRRQGISTNPHLKKLKTTNYTAWKNIMKHAIATALTHNFKE